MYFTNSTYALIVEENYDYINGDYSIYSAGSTIGNNLNNDFDEIFLYDPNNTLLAHTKYNNTYANNNNRSLELNITKFIESIVEGGTPGRKNSVQITNSINNTNSTQNTTNTTAIETQQEINTTNQTINNTNTIQNNTNTFFEPDYGISLSIILSDTIHTELNYTSLFKIKNLDHISGQKFNETVKLTYNITNNNHTQKETIIISNINSYKSSKTGNIYLTKPGTYTICGKIIPITKTNDSELDNSACKTIQAISTKEIPCNISLNINLNQTIFNNKEKIKYQINIDDKEYPFIITYWIEDLFGKIIKKPRNTTNTYKKSWTPKIDKESDTFIIKAKLSDIKCKNTINSIASKAIIIKDQRINKSIIEIQKVLLGNDETAQFGENIYTKVHIYKGNTTKKAIKAYIKDRNKGTKVSETQSISLYENYKGIEIKIPIQLKTDCDNKQKDVTYRLVIEGLDTRDTEEIKIQGNKKGTCINNTNTEKKKINYILNNYNINNNQLTSNISIQNNEEKTNSFQIWSYIYRGSKSYTGYRLQNIQKISIKPKTNKSIILNNNLSEIPAGDYKLKVQIRKNDLKTTYDITKDISIIQPETEEITTNEKINIPSPQITTNLTKTTPNKITGMTTSKIYESKNQKINNYIKIFIYLLVLITTNTAVWYYKDIYGKLYKSSNKTTNHGNK